MASIIEKARKTTVIDDVDICVVGGSCTGVFAAVRAARLGAKVAIVEKQNCFGGVATAGFVNIWHSLYDNEKKKQIIAGLSQEVIERLKRRNAVIDLEKSLSVNQYNAYYFNSEELKIELDQMILSEKIVPYLHTCFVAPYVEDELLKAVIVENKSGRAAIKAKVFIDATGDGDLCHRLGIPSYVPDKLQPPTMCAKWYSETDYTDQIMKDLQNKHREEFGLREDWGWHARIPGVDTVTMRAESHVFGVNCAEEKMLTYAEMEGRRQIRAIMDMIRKYGPDGNKPILIALASYIGIRESRHIKTKYRLRDEELLNGVRHEDAIAFGSYCVDIHHSDRQGATLRFLNGEEAVISSKSPVEWKRWRAETAENPVYYQIPYRSIIPDGKFNNLLAAGRMIDAEQGAFGAVRVMINLNQLGEAAGVAAYLALNSGSSLERVDYMELRKKLKDGGSIIPE